MVAQQILSKTRGDSSNSKTSGTNRFLSSGREYNADDDEGFHSAVDEDNSHLTERKELSPTAVKINRTWYVPSKSSQLLLPHNLTNPCDRAEKMAQQMRSNRKALLLSKRRDELSRGDSTSHRGIERSDGGDNI
jgi:hypothetical protein